MNALENELEYPFGDTLPRPAERFQVAPDVFWVRMPLPFALNHINLYLMRDTIEGEACWTLVDCGIACDEIRGLWTELFQAVEGGLDGLPIRRIICTHAHPDHIGLAYWIAPQFNARLWITHGEISFCRFLSASIAATVEPMVEFFRINGICDPVALDGLRKRQSTYFPSLVPEVPSSFHRLRVDEPVRIGARSFQVILGTGHSPEHAALYSAQDGLLLSGDMVLPRISTNVSVWDVEPESDPVTWFLRSLGEFADCRADTLVLPSHGRPFKKLHRRIEQLREHHAERLGVVWEACKQKPYNAAEMVPVLFNRTFDSHQTTFALGEALAHLHALWYEGKLQRRVGEGGVVRFSATTA